MLHAAGWSMVISVCANTKSRLVNFVLMVSILRTHLRTYMNVKHVAVALVKVRRFLNVASIFILI